MGKRINIIGKKFGRLSVIKNIGKSKSGNLLYKCRCNCGNIKIASGNHLRDGHTKSCGCLKFKRGGQSTTAFYAVWKTMKGRCLNKSHISYKNYGNRGIAVCDEWLNFIIFKNDMHDSYLIHKRNYDTTTIERIDNNKGYFKENCCWATRKEQSHNQRIQKNNKTGINGVFWNKKIKKYHSYITNNRKKTHLGFFNNIKDAFIARKTGEAKCWSQGNAN